MSQKGKQWGRNDQRGRLPRSGQKFHGTEQEIGHHHQDHWGFEKKGTGHGKDTRLMTEEGVRRERVYRKKRLSQRRMGAPGGEG